jgi:hypothetical protein
MAHDNLGFPYTPAKGMLGFPLQWKELDIIYMQRFQLSFC